MGTTLDGYQYPAGFQRDCCCRAREVLGETAFQAAYRRGLELPPRMPSPTPSERR